MTEDPGPRYVYRDQVTFTEGARASTVELVAEVLIAADCDLGNYNVHARTLEMTLTSESLWDLRGTIERINRAIDAVNTGTSKVPDSMGRVGEIACLLCPDEGDTPRLETYGQYA